MKKKVKKTAVSKIKICTCVISLLLGGLLFPCILFARGGQEPEALETAPELKTAAGTSRYERVETEYAEGFRVDYKEGCKLVRLTDSGNEEKPGYDYILVQKGGEVPAGVNGDQIITVPVSRSVMMSTTYVTYLDMLGVLDSLKGMDTLRFTQNEKVVTMAGRGEITEVGSGPSINIEVLLDIDPDLIMGHALGGAWDSHQKMREAGLPVVLNSEHEETHPLGRLEWIKFVALFFNKEEEARHIFERTEAEYNRLADLVSDVGRKPKVMINSPYQGTWWIPGGGNFQARLIRDAGGDYIWGDNDIQDTITVDIEAVFSRSEDADIWINPGMWTSLADGLAEDERFAEFAPFREGRVFNNNRRVNDNGGSLYWETGITRPHIILADLIRIFHPELLPDHQLYYYQRLR